MKLLRLLSRLLFYGFCIIFLCFSYRIWQLNTNVLTTSKSSIIVASGSNAQDFSEQLAFLKLTPDAVYPKLWLWFNRLDRHIKAGQYPILQGDTLVDLMIRTTREKPVQQPLTIIEGIRLPELLSLLKEVDWLNDAEMVNWQAVIEPDYQDVSSYEGLFMPETYYIDYGQTKEAILKRSHKLLLEYLDSLWQNRDESLPYKTAYEALIVASLLEKETAFKPERPLIAGVILKRLQLKMHLGICSTVLYLLPGKQHVTYDDIRIDSPYNTYRNRGLPPTPIALVSRHALWAAFHPEKSDYLYYVSMNNGRHYFSKNYQEHKLANSKFK